MDTSWIVGFPVHGGCMPAADPLSEVPELALPLEFKEASYNSLVTKKPNTDPEWLEKWGFDPASGGRFFTLGKPSLATDCPQVWIAQETGGELRIWLLALKEDFTVKTTIQVYYQDMVEYLFSVSSTIDEEGNIRIEENSMKFDTEGNITPNQNILQMDLKNLCGGE